MMKRTLLVSLMGIFCFSSNLNAINPYQSLQKQVVALGEALDNVNVPVVGKLTALLPFAMIAASFKKCPGQAILVLSGLCAYALWQNDSFRALLSKYGFIEQNDNQPNITEDETLFVFEGDDAEDAFEQAEMEDEMLEADLLTEEEYDRNTTRRRTQQPANRFL